MQRRRAALLLAAALLAGATVTQSTPAAEAGAPAPTRTLTVAGTGVTTYPSFDPAIARYGVRTTAATGGSLTIEASTSDPDGTITVNGRPAPDGEEVDIEGLAAGDEVAVRITDSGGSTSYGLVYLPAGFPAITATSFGAGPSDGLVFLTLNSFVAIPPFAVALDRHGVPAYVSSDGPGNDFKVQPDGRYSIARPTTSPGRSGDQIIALDGELQEVERYDTVGLTNTDFHDSILQPDGSALLMAYEADTHPDETIDSVIQELAPDGSVAFEWDSEDHVPASDALLGTSLGDLTHINSLDVMEGGDLLASFRNTSQVLRIARTAHDGFQPGDVVWRLGGVSSDFTFVDDPEGGFCAQHTARELDDGRILVFDNGAAQATGPFAAQTGDVCPDPENPGQRHGRPSSRVVEYVLDEDAMTATLVWSYAQSSYTQFAGSSQRLADGHTMIGWVNASPMATEVDAAGNKLWELSTSGYNSYRALKFDVEDAIDPTVDVVTPVDGADVVRGQVVTADFACTDTGGSTLQTCEGTVAPGSTLDTSTTGEHTFTVTGTDGAGNATTVTRDYTVTAGPHQPDGILRRLSRGPWIGNGHYGTEGVGQTVVLTGSRGRVLTALVRLQEDGSVAESIGILGSRSSPNFQVRYLRGTTDVSAAVKAGTFETPSLSPGAGYFPLRVEIRVKPTAPPGSEARVRVTGTSTGDPTRTDRVVIVARAGG